MASPTKLDIAMVYRDHGYMVLRRARQILNNDDEAREALQDIFVSLASRPDQFAGASSIATFLYRVTTNHCLNRLRNHRRRVRLVERARINGGWTSQPEATVDARGALRRLPEKLARLAVYYYIDEMTQDEIADLLGCSRRAIGKRLARLHREVESWAS
jgi:RNA polymerase sigma factor (sigma-70 family)